MSIKYKIGIELGTKMELLQMVNAKVFPLVAQSVRAIAAQASTDWQTKVLKAKLWSVEKDAYAGSIKWRPTGDFSAVVESDYKYAEDIESGRPARDLKRMLDTSMKVRRTTDGRRFLVIPFRHGTPGNGAHTQAMPAAVHALASAMTPSRVTGMGQRPVGHTMHLSPKSGMSPANKQPAFLTSTNSKQAATTAQRAYAWGDRLAPAALKQAGLDAAQVRRFNGMVRMDTSTPGGAKSSAYMTFRIMMEGSKGWVVPAKPGLFIAKKVAEEMQPKAQAAFAAAAKATLKL